MNRTARTLLAKVARVAALALVVPLVLGIGAASAQVRYLDDGLVHNARGGWDLPTQGTCPGGALQGYTGIDTRPECVALRLNVLQADCVAPNYSWSTGVCNDLVNTTQAACEAAVDRMWNPGTGVCSIVMFGDDRNNVVCALHQGTWVTTGACTGAWVNGDRTAYTPNLLTGNGAGDQCLRCHNDVTQYNGPRVRDTQETLMMGHRNMSRAVTVGMPWGGPPFSCSNPLYTDMESCVANGGTWDPEIYPSDDSGNLIDWNAGTITVGGNVRDLKWIYGDWLAALPRAIYAAPASTTQVCSDPRYTAANCVANGSYLVYNAGISYSCGRCHTTGWTSDATVTPVQTDARVTKEPERSFPGITFPRLADAQFGQVNLSGGVTGDPNRTSSWDVWGINCTRCHMSAVDLGNVVAGSNPPQYNAPAGMSSHHNNLTATDVSTSGDKGYCSDLRYSALTQCNSAGAAWLTACSVAGVCSNPAYTTSGTCVAGGGTWTIYNTQALCQGAGATWYTTSCTVAGVCNTLNPAHNTQALCEAAGGQWAAATDIVRCDDAGGRWTGNRQVRGQLITRLCMDCHRQETGGLPYDTANPAGALKVGPAHGTVGFVSHPAGNEFLNSPHGKFNGTWDQIGTGKFSYSGTPYGSHFINDGEAANTGNGCTGCHEIHTSVVAGERPFREECTECHAKDLNRVLHPQGRGTPIDMDPSGPEAFEACVTCHMPDGLHLFRINPSASYSTFPMPAALNGTVNANTSPAGTYTQAVWVDVDAACGQCHGGGSAQAVTTGSVNSGSATLTVASSAGFLVGEKIEVPGAGGLYYDEQGTGLNRDNLETYVKAVPNATTITLAGNASATVTNQTITQNATKNGAGYMTKADLAVLAKGIHADKPMATFGYRLATPDTLTINVDASGSVCPEACNAYSWSWGDGTANGSGVTASHTYAAAGTYSVTLTVTQYSVGSGTTTKLVKVYAPDYPPTVAGTCSFDANTWTETVTDASTDTPPGYIRQVTVNWGDGGMLSSDLTAPFGPFTHTYLVPGTFTLTHRAYDNVGQMASRTCTATPAYFTVGGTIYRSNGTTPVSTAMVQIRKAGTTAILRTVYSNALGQFTIGSLKPGNYELVVTKTGFTFTVPAASATVGPNANVTILALSPLRGGATK